MLATIEAARPARSLTLSAAGPHSVHQLPKGLNIARGAAFTALVVFVSLLATVGMRHEAWFDEAQAWLIARDSDPWTIVTRIVRYEGTPGLWHLLLWVFQRVGGSYVALWTVSAGFAAVGAWLVLYKSPFPMAIRIGLVFSYPLAYQYALVARSYAIDSALLPMLAVLFPGRLERPRVYGLLLGLLANTNAHSFILAAPLAAEFAVSAIRAARSARSNSPAQLTGAILYLALAAAAVLQASPPHDPTFASAGGVQLMPVRPLILTLEAFIDRAWPFAAYSPGLHIYSGGLALTLLIVIPSAMLCRTAGRGWLTLGMFGGLLGFVACVYSNYWHSGVFFLGGVFCLWISWPGLGRMPVDRRRWLLASLAVLLTYEGLYTLSAYVRDFRQPYSSGREAAAALAVIKAKRPHDRIAAFGFKTFSVQPWLKENPFADFKAGPKRQAFYRWSTESGVPLYESLESWRLALAPRSFDWLLLSEDTRLHDFALSPYRQVAYSSGYCVVREFRGGLIWKTRIVEPDNLMLFGRCGHDQLIK